MKSKRTLISGWTAFGDNHLFITEADFHRAVVTQIAIQSMRAVFDEARKPADDSSQLLCEMCTTRIFLFRKVRFR